MLRAGRYTSAAVRMTAQIRAAMQCQSEWVMPIRHGITCAASCARGGVKYGLRAVKVLGSSETPRRHRVCRGAPAVYRWPRR